MPTERRKYPRQKPLPDWTISACAAGFDIAPSARLNLAVRMLDVGGKGLCMISVGRLREGIDLFVEIGNAKTGSRFRAKGVVRWSTSVQKDKQEAHVTGVEFMDASEVKGDEMKIMASWVRQRAAFVDDARREHTRFMPAQCAVQCLKSGFFGFSSKNVARKLVDLSEGGLQLDCLEKLEAGQKVKVLLEFKTPSTKVEVEGEIRWCKRNTLILEPHWATGIRFTKVTPDAQSDLKSLTKLFVVMGGARSVDDGPPAGLG